MNVVRSGGVHKIRLRWWRSTRGGGYDSPMRRLVRTILPVACVLAAAAAPRSLEWIEYPYKSEGFAITAPTPPAFTSVPVPTASGVTQSRRYTIAMDDSSVVMIIVIDGSALLKDSLATLDDATIQARMQGGKRGMIDALKAKLVSERDVTISGVPGLQFEVETSEVRAKVHSLYANKHLFQVIAIRPATMTASPDGERVFTSFRLLPAAPAAPAAH